MRLMRFDGFRSTIKRLESVRVEFIHSEYSKLNGQEALRKICEHLTLFTPKNIEFLRFGTEGDGGYVLANFFPGEHFLLSLGVGDNVDFDIALSNYVEGVHLYDPTITKLPLLVPKSTFFPLGISGSNNDGYLKLNQAIERVPPDHQIILKVDIEGSEWEIFSNIDPVELLRCTQIVIELHGLVGAFSSNSKLVKTLKSLETLTTNHRLVNLHANNYEQTEIIFGTPLPNVLEATFLRSDLVEYTKSFISNSSQLNRPNCQTSADQKVGFIY